MIRKIKIGMESVTVVGVDGRLGERRRFKTLEK